MSALFSLSALTIVTAQPAFRLLWNIGGSSDGLFPEPGLIVSGNQLYGVTVSGGNFSDGSVFAINPDGTGYTNLYNFTGLPFYLSGTNTDGAYPMGDLILSGTNLYGTAWVGGNSGLGTVFKAGTNGTGFTNLYSFTGSGDGTKPYAGLVLAGGTLYGTTSGGGSSGVGTVFAINTDGTGYTNLHSFAALDPVTLTNADGAHPRARLVLAGALLYGTTPNGGSSADGTVFAISTNGTGFTNLYSFTALDPVTQTNTDGASPYAGLLLSGNSLYGTAQLGGRAGFGTLFKINRDGTGFTNLYEFTPSDGMTYLPVNGDGAYPYGALILSGNQLYGTAQQGGSSGYGTVFAVNTNGTGFINLYSFTADSGLPAYTNRDGGFPMGDLVLAGSTLYGTTSAVGSSYYGTVFALNLVPALGIGSAGNRVVVSWPAWAQNCQLQVSTNLSPGSWSNVASGITVTSSGYVFTNAANATAAYFRLQGQ
ncbi:MAG TPA: choice-of-anchor tandem repeat GloVer-containing protein [Verrucomicrobiae bacterium]|nr:choice-of-anchor tandem repeat GloVer-containing protein [Verrucomicrobiae bacterium]